MPPASTCRSGLADRAGPAITIIIVHAPGTAITMCPFLGAATGISMAYGDPVCTSTATLSSAIAIIGTIGATATITAIGAIMISIGMATAADAIGAVAAGMAAAIGAMTGDAATMAVMAVVMMAATAAVTMEAMAATMAAVTTTIITKQILPCPAKPDTAVFNIRDRSYFRCLTSSGACHAIVVIKRYAGQVDGTSALPQAYSLGLEIKPK